MVLTVVFLRVFAREEMVLDEADICRYMSTSKMQLIAHVVASSTLLSNADLSGNRHFSGEASEVSSMTPNRVHFGRVSRFES